MVARISFPKRLVAALNYNENKCRKEHAEYIAAVNYLLDAGNMNFHQKHSRLEVRNELNDRATTKTIHISLNFDPSEKFDNEKLAEIAFSYMEKIGFSEQPFLVYKHLDAGHPHIHVVSTTIKEDGSRIHTHNIGRTLSEKARKEIEMEFGLVKAEKQALTQTVRAIDPNKIIYGKVELKRSISNVVGEVFNHYKFCSLPEFNAALKQFNVVADRGNERGRIHKHGGLVYRVLDEKGNKIGVPVKASSIACQPTLKNLEKKFEMNKNAKQASKERTANAIDYVLRSSVGKLDVLIDELKKRNVYTVLRQSEEGKIYGITFVDKGRKVVFNGSDLGREYSAANLLNRIQATKDKKETQTTESSISIVHLITKTEDRKEAQTFIEELTSAEINNQPSPFQLKRKRKKRKKKLNSP